MFLFLPGPLNVLLLISIVSTNIFCIVFGIGAFTKAPKIIIALYSYDSIFLFINFFLIRLAPPEAHFESISRLEIDIPIAAGIGVFPIGVNSVLLVIIVTSVDGTSAVLEPGEVLLSEAFHRVPLEDIPRGLVFEDLDLVELRFHLGAVTFMVKTTFGNDEAECENCKNYDCCKLHCGFVYL